MPNIYYGAHSVPLLANESVLEALLRSGLKIPNSCRAGACQSCMLRATQPPPPSAQLGLKESQRLQNLFFACLYRPQEDVTIDADATPKEQPARLLARHPLCSSVVRLRIQTPAMPYFAGQFIQLRREDGLTRSYSLASLPTEDSLELHVRVIPNGQMSQWLANELTPDEPLYLRGPSGDCFYTSGKPEQPLLLLATGTGLAPLYGILRDALQAGHSGPIHLVHGATSRAGLYLEDELSQLAATHQNLSYERCILHGESEPGVSVGDLRALVKTRFPALRGFRVFICGDPALTLALKKWAFLAGASMKEILADAFVMSPPPAA
jgi:CDP-4-dehydro-6-deoxyglucose reductase